MVSMWETCCAPKLMISSQYIQQDGQELTTTLLHLGGGILKVFTVFIYIYQHISIYIYMIYWWRLEKSWGYSSWKCWTSSMSFFQQRYPYIQKTFWRHGLFGVMDGQPHKKRRVLASKWKTGNFFACIFSVALKKKSASLEHFAQTTVPLGRYSFAVPVALKCQRRLLKAKRLARLSGPNGSRNFYQMLKRKLLQFDLSRTFLCWQQTGVIACFLLFVTGWYIYTWSGFSCVLSVGIGCFRRNEGSHDDLSFVHPLACQLSRSQWTWEKEKTSKC